MKVRAIDPILFKQEVMSYSGTKIQVLVDEFRDGDATVVEVSYNEGEYSCPASCQGTIKNYLKRNHIGTIDCIVRKGKVYLVKKSFLDKMFG